MASTTHISGLMPFHRVQQQCRNLIMRPKMTEFRRCHDIAVFIWLSHTDAIATPPEFQAIDGVAEAGEESIPALEVRLGGTADCAGQAKRPAIDLHAYHHPMGSFQRH